MGFGKFERSMRARTPRGGTVIIHTAGQAAEYLTTGWPIEGEAAHNARDICLAVLSDLVHPKLAQGAVERALRQAGRLLAS